jgi:hypothetical protein
VQYSPSRRTALVLCGTGAHGAYHAGVLRALQEAGVRIDLVAGHGVGAAGAMLAAIDGSGRLFEPAGIWRSAQSHALYPWTQAVRVALWALLALLVSLLIPTMLLLLTPSTGSIRQVAQVVVAVVIAAIAAMAMAAGIARSQWQGRRRAFGTPWSSIAGAPFEATRAISVFSQTIWQLIRGASRDPQPPPDSGRRYADVLADSLGQPGFRELMIIATDLDARGDVVAALLREPYRCNFIAPRPGRERRAEAFDLAGAGREHALDLMAAALTPPVVCEPRLVTFASDGFWRGETHRLCDRPGAVIRLFDELAAAAVSQLVVVTAIPTSFAPHRLRTPRLDVRSRLGEFLAAAEAAALHDAVDVARLRFDACYVVRPAHNPVGPFDVGGAYDEASDRRHSTAELMERGYEDAYHQFIEPVVGASGDQLARTDSREPSSLA